MHYILSGTRGRLNSVHIQIGIIVIIWRFFSRSNKLKKLGFDKLSQFKMELIFFILDPQKCTNVYRYLRRSTWRFVRFVGPAFQPTEGYEFTRGGWDVRQREWGSLNKIEKCIFPPPLPMVSFTQLIILLHPAIYMLILYLSNDAWKHWHNLSNRPQAEGTNELLTSGGQEKTWPKEEHTSCQYSSSSQGAGKEEDKIRDFQNVNMEHY